VYVCWARFTGAGNNAIELATSTEGGLTFRIQRISDGVHGNQNCDIAVTRTGMVFVTWRQFEFTPGADVPQKQRDAVMWVRSTDGGRTFTLPAEAFKFIHWDMTDRSLAGGGRRDCGDGPSACQSGYVFGRVDSGPRNGADPRAGEGDEPTSSSKPPCPAPRRRPARRTARSRTAPVARARSTSARHKRHAGG
jgi:hypothetical protein